MAAKEKALGLLHEKLATVLTECLEGDLLPGYHDDETGEDVPAKRLPPSAAIMTVAAKFLKDNNITCAPSEDNKMGELTEAMTQRQKDREARRQAAKADFEAAEQDMSFMGGLPN